MILIGRGLDYVVDEEINWKGFEKSFDVQLSGRGKRARIEYVKRKVQRKEKREPDNFPVVMTKGIHLFPSRTQKLSPWVPKVLGWRRPGRIGRCRIPRSRLASFFVLKWHIQKGFLVVAYLTEKEFLSYNSWLYSNAGGISCCLQKILRLF